MLFNENLLLLGCGSHPVQPGPQLCPGELTPLWGKYVVLTLVNNAIKSIKKFSLVFSIRKVLVGFKQSLETI